MINAADAKSLKNKVGRNKSNTYFNNTVTKSRDRCESSGPALNFY